MSDSSKTKRIAKNTLVLYIRMVVVMLISLYSSRVILKGLGVEDFGLYNVVGGVVGLFAFLRASMEKATQRFLNFEMAKPDGNSNDVFCVSLTIHILIAALAFVLLETVGLWFLNTYIDIPAGREAAANWVYQAVTVSLCVTIVTVPYGACIISHEKMSIFAIVNVLDAVLKLGFAFMLFLSGGDRLILYGFLMMLIPFTSILIYLFYCRLHYPETKFRFLFDKQRFKEIFGYVGWTLLGQSAVMGTNQGNNILLNMFHGVVANAAMSVGNQVNSAIVSLSGSFQTAFNPQITKSYAEGDFRYLKQLLFTTSKISYFLLLVVSLPIMFNIDFILKIWLDTVPPGAGGFCILCMVVGILNALSAPLQFCVMATGRIKGMQIATAIVYLSDLVLVYLFFKMGMPPLTVMFVKDGIMLIILFVKLYYAQKEVECIDIKSYFTHILLPLSICTAACIAFSFLVMYLSGGGWGDLAATLAMIVFSIATYYYIALNRQERDALKRLVSSKLKFK